MYNSTKENILGIVIKDLQGNFYDINSIEINGNDNMVVTIKKPNEEYK